MSATPRLVARQTVSGAYFWFNFFRCRENLFLYIFYSMYGLQFCIFYNYRASPSAIFDHRHSCQATAVDTVFSNPE